MTRDLFREIVRITGKLVEENLIIDYEKPILKNEGQRIISWPNFDGSLGKYIRDVSYYDKYKGLLDSRNYNFRLVDGSLFQFYYAVERRQRHINSYRLAYYPNIFTIDLNYEDSPYDIEIFEHEIFVDYRKLESVRFPIRFDYDIDEDKYEIITHTKSHLQLGEINNCRLPVCSPISPSHFINFIFRNFYSRVFYEYLNGIPFNTSLHLLDELQIEEKRVLHLKIQN